MSPLSPISSTTCQFIILPTRYCLYCLLIFFFRFSTLTLSITRDRVFIDLLCCKTRCTPLCRTKFCSNFFRLSILETVDWNDFFIFFSYARGSTNERIPARRGGGRGGVMNFPHLLIFFFL